MNSTTKQLCGFVTAEATATNEIIIIIIIKHIFNARILEQQRPQKSKYI